MRASRRADSPSARRGFVPVDKAGLYFREIGQGQPIVVLHGGPDLDLNYLLPEMDRLSAAFRLIYYDQRGRGRSAARVRPEDVSIESEAQDLERVREYFQLESLAVLGHSWGGVLAMEYALRHPRRVSQLILMNTAPASHDDYMLFRQERLKSAPADVEKLKALSSTPGYTEGDPAECAVRIARAIPRGRFVLLKDCGHFSYLECPDQVFKEITSFLYGPETRSQKP